MKKIELRTLAAIFDLNVQQGGFGDSRSKVRAKIVSKLAENNDATQKQIIEMAVLARAATALEQWQNNCASRRLGFLNAQATKSSSLTSDDKPVQNCSFE